ncbi:hypothetical protein [Pseudoxanthomonas sp. UTMC 1351]|uniref:hypothetical protein n=1 Tax=Pseudoxanthomonas sp. UTMC 1351 TaxID=2695853 RepID=UPI0034CF8467
MRHRYTVLASLALIAMLLGGCQPTTTVNTDDGQTLNIVGKTLTIRTNGLPKAEITADGDFSIGGEPVQVTDVQRALLATYYKELNGIGTAGFATGKEGAALAGKAVGTAIKGVLTGTPENIEPQVEAAARKVEAEAMKICDRLGGLHAAQQALVAQLPAFAPYGGLTLDDVADCRK